MSDTSNAKVTVHATKVAVQAATGNIPGAAVTAVTNPGATKKALKSILCVIICLFMVPCVVLNSIPSSILDLVKTNVSSDSNELFTAQYDEYLDSLQQGLSESLTDAAGDGDISCEVFEVDLCSLIAYFSIWKDKQAVPISSDKLTDTFKKKIKEASLLSVKTTTVTKKGADGKTTKVEKKTATYKGDQAFAKYLGLSKEEISYGTAQGSVLSTLMNKKSKAKINLNELNDSDDEMLGVSGAGKKYSLSSADYNLLCKIVAQECSTDYDGSLAVISHMCNLCEYGAYKGKSLMGTAKGGWYSAYTSGAYKKRNPASFVKRAVKDALNGKRNIPPYVLEFWSAGYKSKNWNYAAGERFYKRIGGNDFYYNIKDKKRLKKQTKEYNAALSGYGGGSVVYYNQGESPWKKHIFRGPGGSNSIKRAGCGPTSMAICISTLTGRRVTPIETCDWAAKQGYYIQGDGWSHSTPNALAKHYNLKCQGLGYSKAKLRAALKSGKLVVALMGPGHFTDGGHYIVLRGITKKGKILVADCGGRNRNGSWPFDTVFSEAKSGAGSGGPFWAIYK